MHAPSASRPTIIIAALAAFIALTIGGCPLSGPSPTDSANVKPVTLKPFASEDEVVNYFRTQLQPQTRRGGGGGMFGFFLFGNAAPEGAGADNATSGDDGGAFTTTNLQEQGVDEADVYKSDGTYLYIAAQRSLQIVQADPLGDLGVVGELTLDDPIAELYLYQNTVIAIGYAWPASSDVDFAFEPGMRPGNAMWPPYFAPGRVVVTAIDVSDPANPAATAAIELEGNLATTRLTDGRLIIVATMRPEPRMQPGGGRTFAPDDVRPMVHRSSGSAPLVDWSRWYRPDDPDGYATTVVTTLDAANVESVIGSLGVVADAGTIYMSTEALFLTDDAYTGGFAERPATAIHKITFPAGVPTYAASGIVPGRPLNQFSLDDEAGYLRIATHVSSFGLFPRFGVPEFFDVIGGDGDAVTGVQTFEEPYNAVYVLGEAEEELAVVGAVENIAPGERIFSARFMTDHAFLVTFEQVDPLFILDLADPTAPTVVGELKVPGFSDYLHPVGDDRLIGVGHSTDTSTWGGTITSGIQLSLFDVSDWTNPQAIQQIEIGGRGSESDVSRTHKAFTYLPATRVLALPASIYPDDQSTWPPQQTVVVLTVDPDAGFTELGTVDVVGTSAFGYHEWRRAAIIADQIYAISGEGVRAAVTSDLTDTSAILFD